MVTKYPKIQLRKKSLSEMMKCLYDITEFIVMNFYSFISISLLSIHDHDLISSFSAGVKVSKLGQ